MEQNRKHIVNEVYSWIKALLLALIIAVVIRSFLFSPMAVSGESMKPTFENQDRVIVSKISDIQRFDFIVFDAPDANEYYIKRVIGLPGDTVEVKDKILYINGKLTEEFYLEEVNHSLGKIMWDFTLEGVTGETIVPEGSLFVLGDNRLNSRDSRHFGFVLDEAILGKVEFRYYPLNNIGMPE